jgi:hypothetical protein
MAISSEIDVEEGASTDASAAANDADRETFGNAIPASHAFFANIYI